MGSTPGQPWGAEPKPFGGGANFSSCQLEQERAKDHAGGQRATGSGGGFCQACLQHTDLGRRAAEALKDRKFIAH